jgi:class 3 adenylate cyclase
LKYLLSNNPYWGIYLKISAVYCQQAAFELTFSEGKDDIYGKDIDFAYRLLQKAKPQEIVMNEEFVKQIRDGYSKMSDKESWSLVKKIVRTKPQKIKGFDQAIPIYKLLST